jgi:hypothetical protein
MSEPFLPQTRERRASASVRRTLTPAIKQISAMPNLGVTEAHARDMAAYLATLD